jgi:tRNA acetyltransferase TAN1
MLNRNEVINTIASCVGPAHKVDLKEYELLILVELYKV